jgi:hypothetical protein
VQVGPGSLKIHRRKIGNFLDGDKLVDISLVDLARVKENEFVFKNLVFILPSVTICSTKADYQTFCKLVISEHYLWYCTLRSRIGNKGLRRMKRLMGNHQIRILLSGVWTIETSTFLDSPTEMIERVKSWATSL